jgi:hypothetical protein
MPTSSQIHLTGAFFPNKKSLGKWRLIFPKSMLTLSILETNGRNT